MSNVNVMNPDSAMMQQAEGQWQKFAALMVAKYLADTGKKSLHVMAADIEQFHERDDNVLCTHGHVDSIEFKLVTPSQAATLVAYEAGMRGNA